MFSRLPAILAALILTALAPLAVAADEAAQFRLTAALLDRLDAIQAEGEKSGTDGEQEDEDEDEDDEDDISDPDAFVKRIESDPRTRAMLARHGVAPREFALAAMALVHAGTYLAFEGAMDKQGIERATAGFTAAQRANIELLRQRTAAKK